MNRIITNHEYRVDLEQSPLETELTLPLSHQDALADRFTAALRRGTTPVDLTDAQVTAYLTFSDSRQTLPVAGFASGSTAEVTLSADCYAQPGPFSLALQVIIGDVRHTVLRVKGVIERTAEDEMISSGELLPTMSGLLDDIADMRAATSESLAAAEACNSAAAEAMEASSHIAPPIISAASGVVASITDCAARPAQELVSTIRAAQAGSGDPSPDNVRAISGWDTVMLTRTGLNLVSHQDYKTTQGFKEIVRGDDWIEIGTPSKFDYGNIPVMLHAGVTYTMFYELDVQELIGSGSDAWSCIKINDVIKTFNSTATGATSGVICVTPTESGVYKACFYPNYNNDLSTDKQVSGRFRLAVYVGEYTVDTVPAFEPYQGAALTADLPETVYGGTLDWTTGLLTVTHACITLDSTEAWSNLSGTKYYTSAYLTLAGDKAVMPVCSHYPGKDIYGAGYSHGVQINNARVYLGDSRYSGDTAGLKAYLAEQYAAGTPVTIVYALVTPYTVQLDKQTLTMLKGCNVLRSDCGDTAVTYIADTKMYIDNKIAALAAAAAQS